MTPAVEFRSISKVFRGVYANAKIDLQVRKGSIHAIIGENGAGKSTAMKILYGIFQPDAGEIYLHGKRWGDRGRPWASASDAIHSGIGMVHQHFMLGGPYSVLDNILLGVEPSKSFYKWLPSALRPIDRSAGRKRLELISERYGMRVDWDAAVEGLSVGVQQRIEILKLLYRDAEILILDEPTAVLTPQETSELFGYLRKLSHQGKTILMITHKLKEVMEVADRVSVFRAGKVVGERTVAETDIEELATLMVGRKINLNGRPPQDIPLGKAVLKLESVSVAGRCPLSQVNIEVKGGEVVGICGVEGNGQAELLQLLLHPKQHMAEGSGAIRILDKDVRFSTAEEIKELGVGFIPDDRHRDGLLLKRPMRENFLLGLQRRRDFNKKGLISFRALEATAQKAIEEYDIRPKSTQIHAEYLSGGNQQKVIIAREFKYSPRLLIAAQPTRGVDVGAIEFIHGRILQARSEGSGVLLISSELDEILALSDRILVMYEGKIVAEFKRGETSETALGLKMGGAVYV